MLADKMNGKVSIFDTSFKLNTSSSGQPETPTELPKINPQAKTTPVHSQAESIEKAAVESPNKEDQSGEFLVSVANSQQTRPNTVNTFLKIDCRLIVMEVECYG